MKKYSKEELSAMSFEELLANSKSEVVAGHFGECSGELAQRFGFDVAQIAKNKGWGVERTKRELVDEIQNSLRATSDYGITAKKAATRVMMDAMKERVSKRDKLMQYRFSQFAMRLSMLGGAYEGFACDVLSEFRNDKQHYKRGAKVGCNNFDCEFHEKWTRRMMDQDAEVSYKVMDAGAENLEMDVYKLFISVSNQLNKCHVKDADLKAKMYTIWLMVAKVWSIGMQLIEMGLVPMDCDKKEWLEENEKVNLELILRENGEPLLDKDGNQRTDKKGNPIFVPHAHQHPSKWYSKDYADQMVGGLPYNNLKFIRMICDYLMDDNDRKALADCDNIDLAIRIIVGKVIDPAFVEQCGIDALLTDERYQQAYDEVMLLDPYANKIAPVNIAVLEVAEAAFNGEPLDITLNQIAVANPDARKWQRDLLTDTYYALIGLIEQDTDVVTEYEDRIYEAHGTTRQKVEADIKAREELHQREEEIKQKQMRKDYGIHEEDLARLKEHFNG